MYVVVSSTNDHRKSESVYVLQMYCGQLHTFGYITQHGFLSNSPFTDSMLLVKYFAIFSGFFYYFKQFSFNTHATC